jgi:hypothetical protein
MPRTPSSDLSELLKLLRRIIVLGIAAYGLLREMPYETLALRLAILWAILYISSGLVDIVFRHLSHRAIMLQDLDAKDKVTSGSNVPAAENRAG